jgi:hypothetical protein
MFIVNGNTASKFDTLLKHHMLLVATSDVYFQNARLLKGHHKFLDFDSYLKYYKNILHDIKLETEPIDAFIPFIPDEGDVVDESEVYDDLFIVNRVGPEYEKIDKRVTWEDMKETLPPTHPAIVAITEDPNKMKNVKDDIYIAWSISKYLQQLDDIRMAILSNMTPAIEYVVDNVDEKTIKRHLHTNKINVEKYNKTLKDLFFKPDVDFTRAFYEIDHESVPGFDVELLMQKLCTNIDCKVDSTIVVAIYLSLTFAITDIKNNNTDAKCAQYVRDVLSKI